MKKLAAIYARVSSEKQKEGENIKSQIHALKGYAKEHNYEIPNGWIFTDDGVSGTLIARPALDKLRALIREGDIESVLVYSPDRLSRNFPFQMVLESEFEKYHVELQYFNTPKATTPEEQMSARFKSIFAEYERLQIGERARRGRNFRATQGSVSVIPKAPYGYEYVRKSSVEQAKYLIHPQHSEIVRKIYSLYTKQDLSINGVCRSLSQDGILSPTGSSRWNTSTIRDILRNPAYTGTAYFGKTGASEGIKDRIYRVKGKKRERPVRPRKYLPRENWIPISVPQIIENCEFDLAKEKLVKNKDFSSRNTHEPSILQGLLVCGMCGHAYHKRKRMSGGKNLTYYNCGFRLTGGNCTARGIRQDVIDNIVWNHLIDLLKNPQIIEQEIDRRSNENNDKRKIEERRRETGRELLKINKARDKLLDAYQEGDCLSLEDLRKRLKDLNIRKNLLENELKSLDAEEINVKKSAELRGNIDQFTEILNDAGQNLTIKEKQKVARLLLEDIVVYKDEIKIRHCIPLGENSDPYKNSHLCSDHQGVPPWFPSQDGLAPFLSFALPQLFKDVLHFAHSVHQVFLNS